MAIGFFLLLLMGYLKVINIDFNPRVIFVTIILLFIASLLEEITFRGYLLNNLMESVNKYIALGITAIIFGGLHSLNPNFTYLGLINLILMGIFLGIYYIHVKNLWFPIFLHLSWNYFQGPIFGFSISGKGQGIDFFIEQELHGNPLITGGNFGFEGSIILTIIIIILILVLDYNYRTKFETNSTNKTISHNKIE